MAKNPMAPKPPSHPAKKLILIVMVMLLLSILLGFIAVFVPWSEGDVSTSRVFFYPFQWCIQDTTSALHYTQCEDNSLDGLGISQIVGISVPTAGNDKCKGFFIATIANVFCHVILGVFLELFLIVLLLKLWTKLALPLAAWCSFWIVLICGASIAAWALFIVFAEEVCVAGTVFPVQGYSYGWICYVFASALMIFAVPLMCLALLKIKKTPRMFMEYPVEYPMEAYTMAPMPYAPVEPYPVAPGYMAPSYSMVPQPTPVVPFMGDSYMSYPGPSMYGPPAYF